MTGVVPQWLLPDRCGGSGSTQHLLCDDRTVSELQQGSGKRSIDAPSPRFSSRGSNQGITGVSARLAGNRPLMTAWHPRFAWRPRRTRRCQWCPLSNCSSTPTRQSTDHPRPERHRCRRGSASATPSAADRRPVWVRTVFGGNKGLKGLDSSVSVVPGCSRVTVAWGHRRDHSILRQRRELVLGRFRGAVAIPAPERLSPMLPTLALRLAKWNGLSRCSSGSIARARSTGPMALIENCSSRAERSIWLKRFSGTRLGPCSRPVQLNTNRSGRPSASRAALKSAKELGSSRSRLRSFPWDPGRPQRSTVKFLQRSFSAVATADPIPPVPTTTASPDQAESRSCGCGQGRDLQRIWFGSRHADGSGRKMRAGI